MTPHRQVPPHTQGLPMRYRIPLLGAILAVAMTSLVFAADEKPKAVTYASPDAVFKAMGKAMEKDDYKTFSACLSTESLEALSGGMAVGGVFQVEFAKALDKSGKTLKKLEPIVAVLKKHGLTESVVKKMMEKMPKAKPKDKAEEMKLLREFSKPLKDKAGFLADYLAAMKKVEPGKGKLMAEVKDMKLENVKIDGNKATGSVGEKDKKTEFTFVKEGGSWKVNMPLPKAKDAASPGPKDK